MKSNKKEQSEINRSIVVGKSSIKIAKKSIKIKTPTFILHQQKPNLDY